jgi:hypothetical protein
MKHAKLLREASKGIVVAGMSTTYHSGHAAMVERHSLKAFFEDMLATGWL